MAEPSFADRERECAAEGSGASRKRRTQGHAAQRRDHERTGSLEDSRGLGFGSMRARPCSSMCGDYQRKMSDLMSVHRLSWFAGCSDEEGEGCAVVDSRQRQASTECNEGETEYIT